MATYKEIHGVKVQYRESDATAIEGDVWYNASTGKLKMYASSGSWASGGNITTNREGMGSAGTQTAGLIYGGISGTTYHNESEEYDGSSWTEGDNLNDTRRQIAAIGTQTAALAAGGYDGSHKGTSEEYDGSSWTEGDDLNTAKEGRAGVGIQTAALAAGGSPRVAIVESYDGSSWTEIADLNTARNTMQGVGTQTAGLVIAGETSSAVGVVESWNGTSWTEVGDLGTARYGPSVSGGPGGQTAALAFGGGPPGNDETEEWDGTSWTELADLSTGRRKGGGSPAGSVSLALMAGGISGTTLSASTEEWAVAASVETVAFD